MDSAIDPESEALIRKLHRELNGLTRSTRGGDRARPSLRPSSLKSDSHPQLHRNPEPAHSGKRKQPHHSASSGNEPSTSGSEGDLKHKKLKQQRHDVAADPRTQRVKQASPLETASVGPDIKQEPPDPAKKHRVHDFLKSEHHGGAVGAAGGPSGATASIKREPEAPASSHPKPASAVAAVAAVAVTAAVTFKTPLEAAAAAASAHVKDRAKAVAVARALLPEGQRLIKCFHAGVRWGIALSPVALKTRADLATALNDAFAGEIISCGRGDILNIVFLDGEGRVTEFPSLRNGARDRSNKWKICVESAAKIYVRRG